MKIQALPSIMSLANSALVKNYLKAYNGTQLVTWAFALIKITTHFGKGGRIQDVYPLVSKIIKLGCGAALLEVLHAYLKFVKSPVVTTAIQCIVRYMVIIGAVEAVPAAGVDKTIFAGQMAVAWSISETIRYGYYFSNLVSKQAPRWLTWLRYSAFLVLYPIGITGEMGCFYKALPKLQETGKWSIALPNKHNFAFNYPKLIWIFLLFGYPHGFYTLYGYMLKQRAKQLGEADPGNDEKRKK